MKTTIIIVITISVLGIVLAQDEAVKPRCVNLPEIVCGTNEEYNCCGSSCETTCATLGEICISPSVCIPGCYCKTGFVRKVPKGKCIKPLKCLT